MSEPISKKLTFTLTDWQMEMLESYFAEIEAMHATGVPGMLIGQIYHRGFIAVGILNHDQALRVQEIVGTRAGLMQDGTVMQPAISGKCEGIADG